MLGKQTIYDEITRPRPSNRFLRLYGGLLLGLTILCALLVSFRFLCRDQELANYIIQNITSPVKKAIAGFCSHLPFSMAELMWALAVVGLGAFALRSLFVVLRSVLHRLQGRNTHPLRRFLRRGLALLLALLTIYLGYSMGWGINYYGDTFSQMSGLERRKMTETELCQLTAAFAVKCNELSGQVTRDENGIYEGSYEDLFDRSYQLYECVYDQFPCLDQTETQARPMFFSRLMSWLGFTGFYFPFTGESLVNVDAPASTVPCTILHELAHQRNVALESECDFLAIIVGLQCDDGEFQYSSALTGYIHLGNALYSADRELWREVRSMLNEDVTADLSCISSYWDQFESPVAETAEAVYTGFAESYEQQDIMKSYGACIDLLAAYYLPPPEAPTE